MFFPQLPFWEDDQVTDQEEIWRGEEVGHELMIRRSDGKRV
jgi:hypothetical protein